MVQKLWDMGLGDLINVKPILPGPEVNNILLKKENLTKKENEPNLNVPWWYIGD